MMRPVKPTADRARRNAKTVQGKKLLVGFLGALVLAVGLVFYFGVTGGSTHVPLSKPGIGFTPTPQPTRRGHPAADEAGTAVTSGGATLDAAITKTIADRAVRDDLRRRILAGWAAQVTPR